MKLTEACRHLGCSTKTGLRILREKKAVTKLGGCWYLNNRGIAIVNAHSENQKQRQAMYEAANFYMDDESAEKTLGGDDQNVLNQELNQIAKSIDNIMSFTQGLNGHERQTVETELEEVFGICETELQLADVWNRIRDYIHNKSI